jgi:hypothetical protein
MEEKARHLATDRQRIQDLESQNSSDEIWYIFDNDYVNLPLRLKRNFLKQRPQNRML